MAEETGILGEKVAIVTGSGQGVGKATALALAEMGATLIIAELREDTGFAVTKQIEAGGGRAIYVHADLGDSANVLSLVEKAQDTFGHIDILVNNASYRQVAGILEMSQHDFDRTWRVNYRGPWLLTRALLPGMLERGEGVIVNVNTYLAREAENAAYLAAHAASKAALAALTKALAREIAAYKGGASGVVAQGIWIGATDTPGTRRVYEELAPRYGMKPEELARRVAYHEFPALTPEILIGQAVAHLCTPEGITRWGNGKIVSDMEVLRTLNLIPSAEDIANQLNQRPPTPPSRPPTPQTRPDTQQQPPPEIIPPPTDPTPPAEEGLFPTIVRLCQSLIEMVDRSSDELDKQLPIIIRQFAGRTWKSETGLTRAGWDDLLRRVSNWAQIFAGSDDPKENALTVHDFLAEADNVIGRLKALESLIDHILNQIREMDLETKEREAALAIAWRDRSHAERLRKLIKRAQSELAPFDLAGEQYSTP